MVIDNNTTITLFIAYFGVWWVWNGQVSQQSGTFRQDYRCFGPQARYHHTSIQLVKAFHGLAGSEWKRNFIIYGHLIRQFKKKCFSLHWYFNFAFLYFNHRNIRVCFRKIWDWTGGCDWENEEGEKELNSMAVNSEDLLSQ